MKEKLSQTAPFILLGIGAAALLFGVLSGDMELVLQKVDDNTIRMETDNYWDVLTAIVWVL